MITSHYRSRIQLPDSHARRPITFCCSFYQSHLANERLSRPLGGYTEKRSRVCADLLLFVPECYHYPKPHMFCCCILGAASEHGQYLEGHVQTGGRPMCVSSSQR